MARGIVVIHGMGDHKRGDFLHAIVSPLARYLESKGGKVDFEPDADLDPEAAARRPATIRLKVHGPSGFHEEWRFAEAHWDSSFEAPKVGEVLTWGGKIIRKEVEAISEVFREPLNSRPDDFCRERRSPNSSHNGIASTGTYSPRTERYYKNQAFVYKGVAGFFAKAGGGLLLLVWVLLKLRALPAPPALLNIAWAGQAVTWAKKGIDVMANALVPFMVGSIGDVKAVIDNPQSADAMRSAFERRFLEFLEEPEIDSVTVIAHSLGALISYDALAEGRHIDMRLQEDAMLRKKAGKEEFRRINWVTVGAALNRGYSISSQDRGSHARLRFRSPIAESIRNPGKSPDTEPLPFFWLNIFARYDWVPAGSIERGFFDDTKVECRQFKERLVINVDRPIADHSAYWKNADLVWPRIVRAICDGSYPWDATKLGDSKNQGAIRQRTENIAAANLRRLTLLALPLAVAIPVLLALALVLAALAGVGFLLWELYRLLAKAIFIPLYGLLGLLRRWLS